MPGSAPLGAVAQLGERLTGSQEVRGSIPLGSTKNKKPPAAMVWTHASFGEQAWSQGAHPLEQKKVAPPGMVLLRFEPGFADPNWCSRSHVLFVVSGVLGVEFRDGNVVVPAGDAIQIPQGIEHRVAVVGSAETTLFAVSELEQFSAK
jgi:quercetin dioxygenase-like cupin family protein